MKPSLVEYSYNEFLLDLPDHWKQLPTPEDNVFNFYSETEGASITISADFYAIPDDKAGFFAEKCLESRHDAVVAQSSGEIEVLRRSALPHSGGTGIEMMYAAEVPGECVYFYLGYVTSRKILNFTLVCKPGRAAAAALFNAIVPNFRPKLP